MVDRIMKLVIGLGNPGQQYEQTRHNIGFRSVDKLAKKLDWRWERRGRAMLASGTIGTEKVTLVKPITYMNNSGEAIGELLRWYKLQPEAVLIIYDELDLPIGKVRLLTKGSAGGHNGMKSVISHLHTDKFPRLRLGIGRPTNKQAETINYVLGTPPLDERIQLEMAEDKAVEAVLLTITEGIDKAMNIINLDPEVKAKEEERRRQQLERREQERMRKEAEARQREQSQVQVANLPDAPDPLAQS